MNQRSIWSAVDQYFGDNLIHSDPVLSQVLENNRSAGLPAHDVSANQGMLLHLYVKLMRATRILEIGTLGAYSSIWMARALPKVGKLISLEVDSARTETARKNIVLAGLHHLIEVRVGPALESLPRIAQEGSGPFDLIFIDADKTNNPYYFSWALKLARKGSLIIVDNVVRNGEVLDSESSDPSVQGVRRLVEMIDKEKSVKATVVQTVGTKGWDGYILATVEND